MNVEHVMTREARTCGPHDSMTQAAQIMWESDCGCVPVVDADGKAIGMITDRDICMAAYTQGRPLWQIPVAIAASHGVVVVHARDTLQAAEELMKQHRIRRLAVIDADGRPIGILSMNDLARHASTGRGRGDLDGDTIAKTLAAICAPNARAMRRTPTA